MITPVRAQKARFFSLFLFLFTVSIASSQNESSAHQQQQHLSKIKSINSDNKNGVTNGEKRLHLEAISDSVVLRKNYSSLNSKYETQSAVTSSIGLFPGSKKSEYLLPISRLETTAAAHIA
jgi:outer membrane lipoprotein-sorting protein